MTGNALDERKNGAMLCAQRTRIGYYFGLYLKSLAQKLTEKMCFFVNSFYVTCCDLHGHRRSKVMVRNERLYMSSYL